MMVFITSTILLGNLKVLAWSSSHIYEFIENFDLTSSVSAEATHSYDCQDAFDSGDIRNGEIYTLKPNESWNSVVEALCQFDSTSGWTVLQRRLDGSVDFYRYWSDYVNGFGNKDGEYWIGLEALYWLTRNNRRLSIFLEDHDGEERTANYTLFYIDQSTSNYKLHISGYVGDAGDSMAGEDSEDMNANLNNQMFSTRDADHDSQNANCAVKYKGGWWYKNCHWSNLNGIWYAGGGTSSFATGTSWKSWRGHYYSYKTIYIRVSR